MLIVDVREYRNLAELLGGLKPTRFSSHFRKLAIVDHQALFAQEFLGVILYLPIRHGSLIAFPQ